MKVSLIVAIAQNGVIGKNNQLIWHLPADLMYFKEKTIYHHVILGRKNYLSIPEKYRPLPNRTNIVLSRSENFLAPGCVVLNSLEQALEYCKKQGETEAFIIGGGQIYQEALDKNLVDRMYITYIEHSFEGDTFFPEFNKSEWIKKEEALRMKDDKNQYNMKFCLFERLETVI